MADNSNTPILQDVDGYEVLTEAIMTLVNEYPGLPEGAEISFATLSETAGIALFPLNGAVIERQTKDIWGLVTQICVYPFIVYYRTGHPTPARRAAIKELLDSLGRWLEGQTISVNGTNYKLQAYPDLTGTRRIRSIARTAPAYLVEADESGTEDWAVSISARYTNEFEGGLLNA